MLKWNLIFYLIMVIPVFSQEKIELPPWVGLPDTLEIHPADTELQMNTYMVLSGTGLMILSGAAAWHFHQKAEQGYEKYLREGNAALISGRYTTVKKYDRYTTVSILGFQAGFLMVMKAFFP